MAEAAQVIRSVTMLLLGVVLLMVGNTLLGIAVPLELEEAQYSRTVSGTIMAVNFLGLGFGALYGRTLISQVGHIRAFAFFATVYSAAVIAFPLWFTPLIWGIARFLAGACLAGLYMIIESWLNERTPSAQRGTVLGTYTTLIFAAQIVGTPLINLFDVGAVEIYLIATLLLSLSLIPVVLTRIPAPTLTEATPMTIRELVGSSPLAVATTAGSGVVMGLFQGLATQYGSALGLSVFQISIFQSSMIFGGLLFMLPIGWISDRFDRRRILVGILIATITAALAIGLNGELGGGFFVLCGATIVLGAAMTSIYGIGIAQAYDYLDPEQYVSAAMGLLIAYSAGSFIGPIIGGYLMDTAGPSLMFWMTAATALALLLFTLYRMQVREALAVEEQENVVIEPAVVMATYELDPRTDFDEDEVAEDGAPDGTDAATGEATEEPQST